MPYQPIEINREQAERELQPYIIRWRPIVHNAFDRRMRNLDRSMGDPIVSANDQINQVIGLLNQISSTATAQRNFLRQQMRGTSGRGVTRSRPQAERGTGRSTILSSPPSLEHWLSPDQLHYIVFCLLPYVNHRIVMNTGNTTGIASRDCTLNTDSFSEVRQIHLENQLVTTINANYRDHQRQVALNHFLERLSGILSLLRRFVSETAIRTTSSPRQLEVLANGFMQQQQGLPTRLLQTASDRVSATTNQLGNRYRNILSSGETIIYARAHGYNPEPEIQISENRINRIDNPDGVVINWNHPDLIPVKHLPLSDSIFSDPIDPIFALAITRFLKYIKATLHVVEVYSEGFIRNPIHLGDPHPFGRSWDITGFGLHPNAFGGGSGSYTPRPLVLHLRGGYPVTNLRGGQHARTQSLDQYNGGGPSDWFNIALITEREYREELHSGITLSPNCRSQYLRRIINVMPSFFGFVKGPGSDIQHMDHFHVDLIRFSRSSPSINCPATMLNPTPFIPLAPVRPPATSSTNTRQGGRR